MLIKIKVFPDSKKEEVEKIKDDKYVFYIKERPRNNEANERVLEIAKILFKGNRGIRLVRGRTTQNKTLEVIEPTLKLI